MVFNGLTKSDLIIFNALLKIDLSQPVPISDLASITCYHPKTVKSALKRLSDYQIIDRQREPGQPYQYQIRKDSYAVLDT
jgi:predicted transcriptional regulator